MFSLVCAWINDWVNNGEGGDLRRHRAHYDVTVMTQDIVLYLLYMCCSCDYIIVIYLPIFFRIDSQAPDHDYHIPVKHTLDIFGGHIESQMLSDISDKPWQVFYLSAREITKGIIVGHHRGAPSKLQHGPSWFLQMSRFQKEHRSSATTVPPLLRLLVMIVHINHTT